MSALISISDVCKSFGGIVVADHISIEIHRGEILGLIGPNGAGKTTLFNIISGHLKSDSGVLRFNGMDITNMRASKCARMGIGRTFQIVKPLATLTVHENVTVGALLNNHSKTARDKAAHIIERVGMSDLMDKLSGSLTLESRKRLELARALSIEPKIILLDEILAGLNASEIEESIHLIRSLAVTDNLAVILIEHNLHAIMSLAHKIVVLDYGVKIAQNVPDLVVRDPKVVAAYLGSDD